MTMRTCNIIIIFYENMYVHKYGSMELYSLLFMITHGGEGGGASMKTWSLLNYGMEDKNIANLYTSSLILDIKKFFLSK